MGKAEIIEQLQLKYKEFVAFISALSMASYQYRFEQKWTAAGQLAHIIISIKPLVQVFSMDKSLIAQTFGTTGRVGESYEELTRSYLQKLEVGGKAPERFLPPAEITESRQAMCEKLTALINTLSIKIESFSEAELDTLCIPHPLLGSISLREMLYNAIYHVQHHQKQVEDNLKKF